MDKQKISPKMTDYMRFIATSRYARWREEDKRRETWPEVVGRYLSFFQDKLDPETYEELGKAIHDLEVMPSMRALMTAGPALERNNVAGYNCAYLPVDHPRAFDETMFVLMCGTGIGFSVEERYVGKLPIVNEHFENTETTIRVADSKEGWARSLRELIALLYTGQQPQWDVSGVRPAGSRLKTFGGRASGPAPLVDLFNFVCRTFRGAAGRRLTSLECHDIMCKIGEVVVVGGVRRSAMISLSDLNDDRIRNAKTGSWWELNPQRALANNSAVYNGRPDTSTFMGEWKSLYDSHSGERGMFSRDASKTVAARNGRRDVDYEFGTNPCSEIILRPYQFCNLSEIVVRADDTADTLRRKARLAAILGTIQSTLTNFKYLRKIWQQNTEEERLLGVSLTGLLDHPTLAYDKKLLNELRDLVISTNKEWADRLGIPQSTATTCVKPSGTVSQLVDSASGMHTRHSPFYLRTVRGDVKDPITQFMISQGVPNEPDVMKPDSTVVFTFPMKAPTGAKTRNDLTAIEHLEIWKTLQEEWCEHKPSVTISVREHEWFDVQAWVWKNFDVISGISFLPHSDHTYQQAPYQECDEATYNEWVERMPANIDWSKLSDFEMEDMTTGSQELACTAGGCDIV